MFEKPSEQVTGKGGVQSPIKYWVDYRPGKIPQQFGKQFNPLTDEKIGFAYWDKEAAQKVKLTTWTGWFIGLFSQVGGTAQQGSTWVNYNTNLVADTRTDIMSLRTQGGSELVRGTYQEVKAWLSGYPELAGVKYQKIMVAYVDELQCVCAFHLSQKFEAGLRAAVAAASNTTPAKINLFNLGALTSETWGFNFSNEFKPVDRDGEAYAGKGELSFMPTLSAGVIKINGKHAGKFNMLADLTSLTTLYVEGAQAHFSQQKVQTPTQQTNVQHTPTSQPTGIFEAPVSPTQRSAQPQTQVWDAKNDDLPF